MKKLFALTLVVMMISCKEEITPPVKPNDNTDQNGGGNNGGNNGGSNGGVENPELCALTEFTPVAGEFAKCIPALDNSTIDILTWNIENFPKKDKTTEDALKKLLSTIDADIIGLQEVASLTKFNAFVATLDGWGSITGGGSLRVGYLYRKSTISISPATELFKDDASAFPRPPLMITATDIASGKQVTLINLHLKCCDDGTSIPRRKTASEKLKAYIDANLSTASVVVLGDMNEDITQPEGNGVFTNFINDNTNYKFADATIAQCPSQFSYNNPPEWLSHLDHMLITNELFTNVSDIRTLKLTTCDSQYKNNISDHYPVLMRLTK